jgi:Hg(II)-responsive transcriptional regulator
MVPMSTTIGRVAAEAGVNVQTIRYYERRGLLAPPPRSRSGYRQYSPDAVSRLRFIRHAQELGFSLKEVEELLGLRVVRNGAACAAVERSTRQKIERVEQKIASLQRMQHALERLAVACRTRRATEACPILEALEDHGPGDD